MQKVYLRATPLFPLPVLPLIFPNSSLPVISYPFLPPPTCPAHPRNLPGIWGICWTCKPADLGEKKGRDLQVIAYIILWCIGTCFWKRHLTVMMQALASLSLLLFLGGAFIKGVHKLTLWAAVMEALNLDY